MLYRQENKNEISITRRIIPFTFRLYFLFAFLEIIINQFHLHIPTHFTLSCSSCVCSINNCSSCLSLFLPPQQHSLLFFQHIKRSVISLSNDFPRYILSDTDLEIYHTIPFLVFLSFDLTPFFCKHVEISKFE